ncbi:hypothetical protein CLU79DRAFT_840017 [Phycomyces nitens]|nr:hypothetical protein CLU79DRAFT_840017 [Phycomyces nitens]
MDPEHNVSKPEETVLPIHTYWKNTINVCEAALSLLSVYENKNHALIDATTEPLRQLIRHGRDIKAMMEYNPATRATTSTNTSPKKQRKPLQFTDFDSNWDIIDSSTVNVTLSDKSVVVCKAISTRKELEDIVPEIRNSHCIAIDCEFQGIKSSLPELKLLQIAVSRTRGYAIMVSVIGNRPSMEVLGPLLTDKTLNVVGWAFTADGCAIEGAFKGIELAPVLDLQAKLRSIAVENLSLANAMTRFAKDWEGWEEFQKAKQLGEGFHFTGEKCIWMQNPLPPAALVYSIFDVVSLVALYEITEHEKTDKKHFWPFTITLEYGRKALEKWHRERSYNLSEGKNGVHLRATSESSTSPVPEKSTTPANVSPPTEQVSENTAKPPSEPSVVVKNEPQVSTLAQPKTNERVDGEPVRGTRPGRRIVSNEQTIYQEMEAAQGSEPCDYQFAPDIYEESRNTAKASNVTGGWGSPVQRPAQTPLASQQRFQAQRPPPLLPQVQPRASLTQLRPESPGLQRPAHVAPTPLSPSVTKSTSSSSNNDRPYSAPPQPTSQPTSQPASQPTSQSPKVNVNTTLKSSSQEAEPAWIKIKKGLDSTPINSESLSFHHGAQGSFEWQQPVEGEIDDEKWNELMNNSITHWRQGKDMGLDMSSYERKKAEAAKNEHMKTAPIKFNTVIGSSGDQWRGEKDSWDDVTVRPNTMQMALKGGPKSKYKAKGPKFHNVFDDADSGSESDDAQDESSSDSDDGLDRNMSTNGVAKSELSDDEIFVEDFYLPDGTYLHLYKINEVQQLSHIPTSLPDPTSPLTVAITYYAYIPRNRRMDTGMMLKALQIHFPTGNSYTILVDHIYTAMQTKKNNALAYILTHPRVTRITWAIGFMAKTIEEKLGIRLGSALDMSLKLGSTEGQQPNFIHCAEKYLKDWPNLEVLKSAKDEFDSASSRSFSNSIWDRERVPTMALQYSSLQCAALYTLYTTTEKAIPDTRAYMYPDYQVASH